MPQIVTLRNILFVFGFLLIVFILFPLEVYGYEVKNVIYLLVFIVVPVVVLRLLDKYNSTIGCVLALLGGGIYILLFAIFLLDVIGFCAWSDFQTVYVSKKYPSVKIIRRSFSCFLTDNDYYLVKATEFSPNIKWVVSFNETAIDTGSWQPATNGK